MNKQGFTLIIAVLISSIILSIGLSMFNISIKQSILSATARESQSSFFAADSGIECASYWDYKYNAFVQSGYSGPLPRCANQDIGPLAPNCALAGDPGYDYKCVFTMYLEGANQTEGACAVVTVNKIVSPAGTKIESRGYNTCNTSDPRRTERGIRITQ